MLSLAAAGRINDRIAGRLRAHRVGRALEKRGVLQRPLGQPLLIGLRIVDNLAQRLLRAVPDVRAAVVKTTGPARPLL